MTDKIVFPCLARSRAIIGNCGIFYFPWGIALNGYFVRRTRALAVLENFRIIVDTGAFTAGFTCLLAERYQYVLPIWIGGCFASVVIRLGILKLVKAEGAGRNYFSILAGESRSTATGESHRSFVSSLAPVFFQIFSGLILSLPLVIDALCFGDVFCAYPRPKGFIFSSDQLGIALVFFAAGIFLLRNLVKAPYRLAGSTG